MEQSDGIHDCIKIMPKTCELYHKTTLFTTTTLLIKKKLTAT